MRARAASFVLAISAAACGAPSSFDGLTGGTIVDDSVGAPRQISPLSVTTVSTSRPRFKWEIGEIDGAVVELSKTRAFDGEVKEFSAKGRELVVPEDLEPGIWFWRLRGTAAARVGTKHGPTWEVLVRGAAKHGSSDVPTGAILDVDGDGEPDLAATANDDDPAEGKLFQQLFVFRGAAGKIASDAPFQGVAAEAFADSDPRATIAGGVDFDGDGYADLAQGLGDAFMNGVTVTYGGKDGIDMARFGDVAIPYNPFVVDVQAAGDVNGDGYGDLLSGLVDTSLTLLGGSTGLAAFLPIVPEVVAAMPTGRSRPILAGFDADGDGLSDIALATPQYETRLSEELTLRTVPNASDLPISTTEDGEPPLGLDFAGKGAMALRGGPSFTISEARMLTVPSADARARISARAFATGDFNGDGLSDVAATMPLPNGPRVVCVWFGSKDSVLVDGPCVAGNAGDVDFGDSLTAADLDADGQDELLATATGNGSRGVRVVSFAGSAPVVTPLGQLGFGSHLTTIWPGRPGKARWAAVSNDGHRLGVFVGTDLDHTVDAPRSFSGTLVRFEHPIR